MNQEYKYIKFGNIVLVGVFLFSIFIHTEFSDNFLGLSLRHIFILVTIPSFILSLRYKKNNIFGIVVICTFIILLAGTIFSSDFYVDKYIIYAFLTYCIPFFFISNFFNDWDEAGIKMAFIVSIILLGSWKYLNFFGRWNPNCIAYLYFGGINLYLLLPGYFQKCRKKRFSDTVYLVTYLFGIYLLFQTESRNVIMAQLVVLLMFFFKKFFRRKHIYNIVSLVAIASSAISISISEFILNNETVFSFFYMISSTWFGKNTVFDGRIALQLESLQAINRHPVLGFGHMPNVDGLATHNNYLTIRYSVGLIGVLLCAVYVYVILKRAYENFSSGVDDAISYILASIIIGFLIQMGAESFLFGNDIIVLMPYFFMGVILQRNRRVGYEFKKAGKGMD